MNEPAGQHDLTLAVASQTGTYEWWPAEDRVTWSAGLLAVFGFDRPPTTEGGFAALVHPDDRMRVEAETSGYLQSDVTAYSHSFRIVRADGAVRFILDRGAIERDAAGSARVLRGLNIDVTDLPRLDSASMIKQGGDAMLLSEAVTQELGMRRALAESEARLRAALKAGRVGVHEFYPRTNVVKWDATVRGIWGIPADEPVTYETFARGLHPEDVAATQAAVEAALDPDGPRRYEAVYRVVHRQTGEVRWVRADGDVTFEGRTAVRLLGTVRDITERKTREATLAESEARLRRASRAAMLGVHEFDPHRQEARWSPEMNRVLGRSPNGPTPIADILATVHPEDHDRVRAEMAAIQRRVGPYELECRIVRPDGAMRWVMDRGEAIGPVDPATGLVARVTGTLIDITERKQAEERLRAAHDTFRRLVDRSPFGIYVIDADFRLVRVSEGAQKVFEGVRPLIGRDFAEAMRIIWPEPFATEALERFRHTLATGEPYRAPNTIERRADVGTVEAYDWKIERITLPDGRPGIVCHFYDLSERQRHEEQIRLLMREVNHRAKNMLGLVLAIARQTVSRGADDFLERFGERMQSLAAAQDLLLQNDHKAVPLAELVRSQLSHFADLIDTRIAIDGPALHVVPAASQALGMALNELATNAAKYGALSNETGRVAIAWAVRVDGAAEPQFTISWAERDGPAVVAPERRGFGSMVMTSLATSSLGGGEATVDYASSGVVWRLACPAARIVEARPVPSPAAPDPAPAWDRMPARPRVLVVEDEPLIAAEIASMLAEAGFAVIGPAGRVAEAMALLDGAGCDVAVLDVNLGGETSEPIAQRLIGGGTPFVVVSGYARDQLPEIFQAARLARKPLRPSVLERELRLCLGPPAPPDGGTDATRGPPPHPLRPS